MAKEFHELNESILNSVSESIKDFCMQKIILAKKTTDYSVKHQLELAQQYDELEKIKIRYEKAIKEVDVAKKKYDEALKKPKGGLKSLKTMVTGKDSAAIIQKLKTKVKNKTSQANEARNDYLLALMALNTAQGCYENNDLPRIMEVILSHLRDWTARIMIVPKRYYSNSLNSRKRQQNESVRMQTT